MKVLVPEGFPLFSLLALMTISAQAGVAPETNYKILGRGVQDETGRILRLACVAPQPGDIEKSCDQLAPLLEKDDQFLIGPAVPASYFVLAPPDFSTPAGMKRFNRELADYFNDHGEIYRITEDFSFRAELSEPFEGNGGSIGDRSLRYWQLRPAQVTRQTLSDMLMLLTLNDDNDLTGSAKRPSVSGFSMCVYGASNFVEAFLGQMGSAARARWERRLEKFIRVDHFSRAHVEKEKSIAMAAQLMKPIVRRYANYLPDGGEEGLRLRFVQDLLRGGRLGIYATRGSADSDAYLPSVTSGYVKRSYFSMPTIHLRVEEVVRHVYSSGASKAMDEVKANAPGRLQTGADITKFYAMDGSVRYTSNAYTNAAWICND